MFKKCFLFFLSFMFIASSCAVAFSSSALETVYLPFPSPEKFDDLPVLAYERSDGQYYMIVLFLADREYMYYQGNHDRADYKVFGQSTEWKYRDNKIMVKSGLDFNDSYYTSSYCVPMIYYYNPSNGYYNIQINQGFDPNEGWTDVLNIGSNRTISEIIAYNGSYIQYSNDSGLRQHNKQFVFSGELNQPDLHSYLLQIDNSLKIALQAVNTLQTSQTSKFNRFISEYVKMNSSLSSIDSNLQILVDSMTEEHSAPATTENAQISEYNQAENEVAGSHFSALDNFSVPDFGGGLGNIANALNFIGRSLEDLTGNSHSNISSVSIDKIGTVLFTVLMIGLVSLILNMVHNKE